MFANTDPAIHITLGTGMLVIIGKMVLDGIKEFRHKKIERKTFADDPEHYWRQMKEVVTEPLAEVLKGTNEILRDLRDRAMREEGRREKGRR